MVRVKIRKNWYYGELISDSSESIYGKKLVRYKLETGKHTTGWFESKEIEECIAWNKIEHHKRITNNYRIRCITCGYRTVTEQKEQYGMCPNCMKTVWNEIEYVGTY